MKFHAKHVTLEVEVTQLDGNERKFSTRPLNAAESTELLDRLIKEDDDFDKAHQNKGSPIYGEMIKHNAKELADIYNTEPEYWITNFDGATIRDVKSYVVDELLGIKKKA